MASLEWSDEMSRHFAKEEDYRKAFRYEGLAAHKAEHDSFTAKARELKARSDQEHGLH